MDYKKKLEFYVAASVFLIGVFFTYQAFQIRPFLIDVIGPRALPLSLSILLIIGSLSIFLRAILGNVGEIQEGYGFKDSNVKRIISVIISGAIYVVCFWAFGYFLATFVTIGLIMIAFGHTNIIKIILFSLVASLIYQFIFMGMMGLYDPAGEVLDLRKYTNWIIGA